MFFGSPQPQTVDNLWCRRLDRFVKDNQPELAALFWGLWLVNGKSQGAIGIDLQPKPHFIYCPLAAIEQLNVKVENRLQELLGIIENHQPEIEVVMIGIGRGEIKLVQFAPQPSPPECFEQVGQDVDGLLAVLEQRMNQQIKSL
jgi:hypothetical protein